MPGDLASLAVTYTGPSYTVAATKYDDPDYILFKNVSSPPSDPNEYVFVSNKPLQLGQVLMFTNDRLGDYQIPGGNATVVTPGNPLFGSVEHSYNSAGGTVYGLTNALLGSSPSRLQFENYAAQLNAGVSPTNVAAQIIASPDYAAVHPVSQSDADYIASLYDNGLHRPSDAVGRDYFLNELSSGVSRATVAVQIATSLEGQDLAAFDFRQGEFVPDKTASDIARLYYGVVNRTPDANGFQYFVNLVKQGDASLSNVAQNMISSLEYAQHINAQSDVAFVDALYVGALGRHAAADPGSEYWTNALAHGATRADVAVQISESPEAQTHHVSQIEQGWNLY
ncbi:DUF4214 domain-containing protein [Methylobacterium nigriterrae]|uniref:DUF4214 domain-containing protein n=1 Tax=Methylobacterium nigriterrae TaxID=3127512 RepID=UPI0030134E8D